MGKPSTKTPQRVARMIDLHAQGASAREIADDLDVAHGTILSWLEDSGLKPNGGQGARKGRARVSPEGPAAAMAEAQKKLAELTSGPAPANFGEVLERLRKDFGMFSGLVEFHVEGARDGASSMDDVAKAIRLQKEYAVWIRELTPREPESPESDPANLEAAATVRRKLASLVEAAERATRCKACGANPYGKGRAT
jgi:transposase